jgi:hypothetical protein
VAGSNCQHLLNAKVRILFIVLGEDPGNASIRIAFPEVDVLAELEVHEILQMRQPSTPLSVSFRMEMVKLLRVAIRLQQE